MRVLSLSTVFPNPQQPDRGVFVRERLRHVAATDEVEELTIVAPIPYFPVATGRMQSRPAGVVRARVDGTLRVLHPPFWTPPGVGKSIDGLLYAASVYPTVRRLHRERPLDVIDAHFAYPDGFAAVLIAGLLGTAATVTLRGTLPDLATYRLRRPSIRYALERASAVLSVSAALRDDAAELGIDPRGVTVVANGVDSERFRPTPREAARRELGLDPGAPTIVTVAPGLHV